MRAICALPARQSLSSRRNAKWLCGVLGKRLGAFTASPVRYAVFHAVTAALRSSSLRLFTAEVITSFISAGVRSYSPALYAPALTAAASRRFVSSPALSGADRALFLPRPPSRA